MRYFDPLRVASAAPGMRQLLINGLRILRCEPHIHMMSASHHFARARAHVHPVKVCSWISFIKRLSAAAVQHSDRI